MLWLIAGLNIHLKVSFAHKKSNGPQAKYSVRLQHVYIWWKTVKIDLKFSGLISIFSLLVQHECIPQALLGMDIICQAKSGMGKTAVFVLATLHQLNPTPGEVHAVILCHTRELAFQIQKEFERFSKYLPDIKSRVFYGGPLKINHFIVLLLFVCSLFLLLSLLLTPLSI